MVDSPM